MKHVSRVFTWICQPQALVGFIALCLGLAGCGSLMRPPSQSLAATPPTHIVSGRQQVRAVDCSQKPCLALTFDDGPQAQITPQVLDVLARQQVPATFFVIGVHIPGNEALLQRTYREGHEIGNHSWDHPDLSALSPEEAQAQIEMTQRAIANTGVPLPKMMRPPYGAVNDMLAAHNRLTIVRWTVDPEDWKVRDPVKIQEQLLAQAHPGAIILMHDIYPATATALEPALQSLKQTYQFVTVSQLLKLSPGDQGQFFARQP